MKNNSQLDIVDNFINKLYPYKKYKGQNLRPTLIALAPKELVEQYKKQPTSTLLDLPIIKYKGKRVCLTDKKNRLLKQLKFSWPLYLRNGEKTRKDALELLTVLNSLNNVGYTILINYFPSICSKELSIYTTPVTYTICIESDTIEKGKQVELMESLKPYMVLQLDTGGKSIHNYFKFNMENPNKVLDIQNINRNIANKVYQKSLKFSEYHEDIKAFNPYIHKNLRQRFTEFDNISESICKYFDSIGYEVDRVVAKSLNRLCRLPGFKHNRGNVSKVIFENGNYEDIKDIKDLVSIGFDKGKKVKEEVTYSNVGALCINSNEIDIFNALDNNIINFKNNNVKESDLLESKREKGEVTYSNVGAFKENPFKIDNKLSPLMILTEYYNIKDIGITERGIRDKLNVTIAKAHKILNYTSGEAQISYESILEVCNNSNLNNEDAISKYLNLYENLKWMPYIPYMQNSDLKSSYLDFLDAYPLRVTEGKYKILRYYLEVVCKNPKASLTGNLSLKTSEMKEAGNGIYLKPLAEFKKLGVVTCTNENYSDNRTKRYRVNIILLLYVLGITDEALAYGWRSKEGKLLKFG
ncbi:hypothetical protein P0Y35_16140 [Kiritimatiellaeota bacterium B1221]|nr:hypothetical protein [Kiritimatiellaeota bacterium B1221]